jgi:hypothetical protein
MTTYPQEAWGLEASVAGQTLAGHFNTVYGATFSTLEVGVPGAGYSITFTSASGVSSDLPSLGAPAPLASDFLDPPLSLVNGLVGEVTALALTVDFADAGVTLASSGGEASGNRTPRVRSDDRGNPDGPRFVAAFGRGASHATTIVAAC